MALLVTDAIVLHSMHYLESSLILRLATREGGVRSALARGARRSTRRFGGSLDLFAQGSAQLHVKPGRDLDTVAAFDITRARPDLGGHLARFTAASAIAELTMRLGHGDADPALFDAIARALDDIGNAGPDTVRVAALAGAWRIIAELGFAPSIDACSECHEAIDEACTVRFSHPAGGALCANCARLAPAGRLVPPAARAALRAWLAAPSRQPPVPSSQSPLEDSEERAHQRLLREFLHEHLVDDRRLRAFEVWEHDAWARDEETAGKGGAAGDGAAA